ncbi:hypothetical protein SAMN05421504_1011189 [Amycolatopsis xylanica]|uniref:Uncharacterized protein n=1 Tax=Amycolatopsis xylanica TaxID=589385 RepID=A0A1H2VDB4_9PSEU|nr:hypothetical protein [Amycolatopsis xylanica]SDW66347.1 hypothetical protein SAMN05421504_1011189 [Amycolatopsis xylanica]
MINWKGLAAGVAATAAAGTLAAPMASASEQQTVTYTPSCSAGGFTGTLRIIYREPVKGRADYIYSVEYRINKGSQHGGNQADVHWQDGATAPTTVRYTYSGIQDGNWHTLTGGGYSRGRGDTGMKFVFDKLGPGDPSCQLSPTALRN